MPAYDYKCGACNYTKEIHHGMKSVVVVTCPKCKTQKMHKVIAPVPSHFIGKGWAKDGYS